MKLGRAMLLIFTLAAVLVSSCRLLYSYGTESRPRRYTYWGGPGRFDLRMGNTLASQTVPAEAPTRGDAWGIRSIGGGPSAAY
jgi:hypothetical protein